jgi:hypothetical protein
MDPDPGGPKTCGSGSKITAMKDGARREYSSLKKTEISNLKFMKKLFL